MTDRDLQDHVQSALAWEPGIDAAGIGGSVDGGVVALRGDVRSYAERMEAERVAAGVFGVKAVANEISVPPNVSQQCTDTEIAQAVGSALQWNAMVPAAKIAVTLSNGWVTLKGEVDWDVQRAAAANAIRNLTGVRGVDDRITVKPNISIGNVKEEIEAALKRNAKVDARRINVAVADGKVTLSGNVHSYTERREARQAAWAAPGVREVEDRLAVVP